MAFITISKENYFYNLTEIEKRVKKEKIAVVLKDNSYGHGLLEIGTLAKEFGVSRAVVRNLEEAQKIAHLFSYILILAPKEAVPKSNFFYTINSFEDYQKFKNCNFEIKVDTGMHRLGIGIDEVAPLLKEIQQDGKEKNFQGVFTHFREADELSSVLFWQREKFKEVKKVVRDFGFTNLNFHSNNSAGVFRSDKKIEDEMVRVGIATYGYLLGDKTFHFPKLKPVLSLWGEKIGELKNFDKNWRVGYGGVSTLENIEKVGVYDIGYGDGFRRVPDEVIQKKSFRTVENFHLIGRVSMDSAVFNSNLEKIEIFNSVSQLAKIFNTIEYEILVSLNSKIRRIIQ